MCAIASGTVNNFLEHMLKEPTFPRLLPFPERFYSMILKALHFPLPVSCRCFCPDVDLIVPLVFFYNSGSFDPTSFDRSSQEARESFFLLLHHSLFFDSILRRYEPPFKSNYFHTIFFLSSTHYHLIYPFFNS